MTNYALTRAVERKAGRNRIVVGGVDVTFFRDYVTPFPRYSLSEPFAYGATSIQFPQVHAGYEAHAFGQSSGDLSWVKQGAPVTISRVFGDGSETIDYRGRVISIDPAGRILNLDIGGQFSGPATLRQEQNQMYRQSINIGRWASIVAGDLGLRFDPWFGPALDTYLTHVGGQSHLSWAQYVCSMSQTDAGIQRTIMPKVWGSDVWEFREKDYTTVHATAFNDDARVVLDVTDDASEQPNVIYGTGITPDGVRITNAKWPNVFAGPSPDYPIAGGTAFGLGTTNADTVNGDGITVLWDKLRNMDYLPFEVADTGVYTSDFVTAVKRIQHKAGESQTGTMTVATWNALYDNAVAGYKINGAYIAPLAEDDRVREFNRSSNGAILGRNPLYDPTVLRVEVTKDYGTVTKDVMIRHAQGILARSNNAKNWAGTLRLNGMGLFTGDRSASDRSTLTAADIMPMRDLRPGMNVLVPDFDGGTLFHVAGCEVEDVAVTATVDTQARDLLELSEILSRNADSRRDIRREWNAANRPSQHSNALITSDENFGILDRKVALKGGQWNRVPLIVGQQGQVNRVDIQLTPGAEFSVAILNRDITTKQMFRRVGNPMTTGGQSVWETGDVVDWINDRVILYARGDGKQPCGYGEAGHRRKLDDNGDPTGAPLTGNLIDDAAFPYICAAHTQVLVYVFIWPDRDCTLKRGQILYCQLDAAA